MEDFKIVLSGDDMLVFEETSVELDTRLYVQVGETSFPDPLWTDYTLFVLSMWSEAFQRHRALTRQTYSLPFMDGPFEVEVVQEDGRMTLQGISSRRERRKEFCCNVSIEQFRRELFRTWNQLRKITWFCERFQKPESKQTALETIDHYREQLRTSWNGACKSEIFLDFSNCRNATDIHTVLKDSLGFPDRYGANWSAFWDYLDDFCGDREENTTIRLVGLAKLPKDLKDDTQKMLEILHRAGQQYPLIHILEEAD